LKQEFVALISHDLRTPLTSVGGILELMSRGAYGETSTTAQTQIGVARRNLDRVLGLISQLLDMEKLESGTIELDIKDVTIKSILQRASESVSAFAEQRQVAIEIADRDVLVIADAERIVQVVVNLLSNAVKFSPPGAKISVSVTDTVGPPPAVEISVKDEGPGVAAEAHELIFQKFRQSGAIATDREKGGTGLGLAICKAIVELHGGQIGVDSTPGGGARFWFTLQPTSIS
jgi:signal transduction histidine kinase